MSDSECPIASPPGNCTFVINTDISGVGVRTSFYVQTFMLVLLVNRSWEEAPTALWTFIATSFGLTISAVVQAIQQSLTLFQALQVSNLVWLANFGCFVSLASYSRKREKRVHNKPRAESWNADNPVRIAAMVQTLFSMSLTIYMWANAAKFSCQQDCAGQVVYVFFVGDVLALRSGKIAGLTISSTLALLYLGVTVHELYDYLGYWRRAQITEHSRPRHRKHRSSASRDGVASLLPSSTAPAPDLTSAPAPAALSPDSSYRRGSNSLAPPSLQSHSSTDSRSRHRISSQASATTPRREGRPDRHKWSPEFDPMLLGIGSFLIIIFAYFIVSTELLITHNHTDNSATEWGFGQIMALILVVPSVYSTIYAFYKQGFKPIHKHNKDKDGKSGKRRRHGKRDKKVEDGEKRLVAPDVTVIPPADMV
ncbi:hypothetical protein PLICRDRAFT_674988 [Plicaturopsis crispa FD-325 SS-3]|nr:hypothetical protein PLICRDRAFT_674988 [Plicaturopsis crispa FD-325 SS-3]